jgi:hypothetical protein
MTVGEILGRAAVSVIDRIREKIQFPGGYMPAAYLNDDKLLGAFVAEVGELEGVEETADSTRELGGEGGLFALKATGKAASASGTTLQVTLKNPETQALILWAIARKEGRVVDPCEDKVPPKSYVELEGTLLWTDAEGSFPPFIDVDPQLLAVAQSVEEVRAYEADATMAATHTVAVEAACATACVVSHRWVRTDTVSSYNGCRGIVFGQMQRRMPNVILVAPLAIWIIPPG